MPFSLPSVLSLKLAAISAAAAFTLGAFGGGWLAHELAQGRAAKLEVTQQRAFNAAIAIARTAERAQAETDFKAGMGAFMRDQIIQKRTITLIQKVPTYVTQKQDVACVSYGLVRVLDAAVSGADPADLELPAGQSDDACSPVKPSDLARSVAGNYGVASQNAEQLNSLIVSVKERTDAYNKP